MGQTTLKNVQVKSPSPGCRSYAAPLLASALLLAAAGCGHIRPQYNQFSGSRSEPQALASVEITNRMEPEWLRPATNLFTLGPGDRLDIEVIGETNTITTTAVGPDGKVYFSLLPGVDVWGLTLGQAKARLEEELGQFVREKPPLSVSLRSVESKRVWILGRVQAPGIYPISAPTTLLEAISFAGGTLSMSSYRDQEAAGINEELADLKRAFVVRQGKLLPVNFERLLRQGDMAENIYLQPDDFIYVPGTTAREVYVLGAVQQPQRVAFRDDLTVAKAIASCYGTIPGAYMRHVAVVRGSLQEPQIAVVDYRNVIRGDARDIKLEPHDIVYVPFSPYRYLHKYAQTIVNTFVASTAINAGSKAVADRPTAGAGIFIPVGSGIQVIPPASPPPIK